MDFYLKMPCWGQKASLQITGYYHIQFKFSHSVISLLCDAMNCSTPEALPVITNTQKFTHHSWTMSGDANDIILYPAPSPLLHNPSSI